ncbi:hypothetical protein [Geodermatophilus sp. SYSU D00710]
MRAPEDLLRVLAGLSWVLLLFGLLYLVAAVAPDSGMYWDTERQSRIAWIGIALLVAAVPVGLVALVLDRPHHGRPLAPGESRSGIRHPVALASTLASAVLTASAVTVVLVVTS